MDAGLTGPLPVLRVAELWRYPVTSLLGERLTGAGARRRGSTATAGGRCSTWTRASGSPPGGCPTCCSPPPGCAPAAEWRWCCPTAHRPPTTPSCRPGWAGGIGRDPGVLRTVHRELGGRVAARAAVLRPGLVREGDRVRLDGDLA